MATLAGFLFYGERPKPWDTQALRVKHVKAEGITLFNEKLDEVGSTIRFTVDVENKTGADVMLPSALRIMGQTRGTRSLHDSFLKPVQEYFLPAHHTTTISLDAGNGCVADYPPQQCFDGYFKDDEYLIIFDESHKYEILIPTPTLTLPSGPSRLGFIKPRTR